MSGKSSQRKGADGERELCELLRREGFPCVRGPSQSYGHEPDLSGMAGVHIECKRNEKLNIWAAMEQAERDAERFQDGAPTVFFRRNRGRWRVCMNLSDWLALYRAWKNSDFSEVHKRKD